MDIQVPKQVTSVVANEHIRMIFVIILSVFIGYTLMPLPKKIETLFKESQLFKFAVLFLMGLITFNPSSVKGMVWIVVVPILFLLVLHLLRKAEEDEKKA